MRCMVNIKMYLKKVIKANGNILDIELTFKFNLQRKHK